MNTIQEWRTAMATTEASDDGHTAAELSDNLGIPRRTMQKRLAEGVRLGLYIKGKGTRTNARGARMPVAVYRLAANVEGKQ